MPLLRTCKLIAIRDIQKGHIKHPMAMQWMIGSWDSTSMQSADSTRKTTSNGLEQCSDSGKGNQIFITLLPVWSLGQRSGYLIYSTEYRKNEDNSYSAVISVQLNMIKDQRSNGLVPNPPAFYKDARETIRSPCPTKYLASVHLSTLSANKILQVTSYFQYNLNQ